MVILKLKLVGVVVPFSLFWKESRIACFDLKELLQNAKHGFPIVGLRSNLLYNKSENQLHPTKVS